MGRREQILKTAEHVLGNRELAEWWLTKPALGLDHRSPCSLLVKNLGYGHVRDFLIRLEQPHVQLPTTHHPRRDDRIRFVAPRSTALRGQ
ncbi:hypothetical protein BL240_23695 [Pseudomonas putida]|uniref:Antitoxin Xre/MbcA/ParS-like toxin-binding domain-containing protein n=2 Tax=Pseudomonas putida TaxID=303 RepID=A0A1L5PW31_PSEPU|nr:hypothetical protein BL240_23695 [Pseudomonas putida]